MTALPVVPIAPDLRFAADKQHAYLIRDDSMNEVHIESKIPRSKCWVLGVDYDEYLERKGPPPSGEWIVAEVEQDTGRRFIVREVRWQEDKIELAPRSRNPAHQPMFLPRAALERGQTNEAGIRIAAVYLGHAVLKD